MTKEETQRILKYILSVFKTLSTSIIAKQILLSTNNVDVGYRNVFDYTSTIKIYFDNENGTGFHFSPELKKDLLEKGFDKDDYFNLSLSYNLIFNYEDLLFLLTEFCKIPYNVTVTIPVFILELIKNGKLDEHTTIPDA